VGKAKTLTILTVLTVGAVAGAYLTQEGADEIPLNGKPLVPGMLTKMNKVKAVTVTGSGKSFQIKYVDGRWVIPERDNYVASAQQMQKLLVGLSETVRIEPKTSKPHLYGKVGLGDPTMAGPDDEMVRFALKRENDEHYVTVTVGNEVDARGNRNLMEYYVLKDDDPQVWLVQGRIPTDRAFSDWIDVEIIGLEPQRAARTVVKHPDGAVVVVTRDEPQAEDFTLVGQPADTKIVEKWQVEDIGRGIARVDLEDVVQGTLEDIGGVPGIEVTMHTHDGMEIVMTSMMKPRTAEEIEADEDLVDRVYAKFSARFNENLVNQKLFDRKEATAELDLDEMKRGPARSEAAALRKLEDPDQVKAEVKRLNALWADWVYELPNFKAKHLLRKMDALVAPVEQAKAPEQVPASARSSN